jgi:hypothetical protein
MFVVKCGLEEKHVLLQTDQTGSGPRPSSISMGKGLASVPGLKRLGREVYGSLPPNHEVMDEWLYTCTPLRAVTASAGTLRPCSHVSHFLGRARSCIVFAVGKTQVY